jgi:hypothetical protein
VINESTCFILGAGASQPYGFPLGRQLLELLCSVLDGEQSPIRRMILDLGVEAKEIKDFTNALYHSGFGSIDTFLERRPEFTDIGRLTVALKLSQAEADSNVTARHHDGHWMEYLYSHMSSNVKKVDDFVKNKISFITFNYDRSLERYLQASLTNGYGISPERALAIVNELNIFHIHGKIGSLDAHDNYYVPYIKNAYEQILRNYKTNQLSFRFYHEISAEEVDEKILSMYRGTSRFYFIGFGYAQDNLNKIAHISRSGVKKIGTAFGLEDMERQRISRMFSGVEFGDKNEDALLFLKKRVDLA